MSRFDQEWALVPPGARWTAVLAALALTALIGGIFLLPAFAGRDPKALVVALPFLLLAVVGALMIATYVLLLGYVWGDARRRGMNHVLWTFLALLIPYAVGLILYFIIREPVAVTCPSCGTRAHKRHAFCANCGTAVRRACPSCRQPVEPAWRNCASCGQPLQQPEIAPGG
jgi:hypothetical protein